jgi:hypothetical protein
MDQEEKKKRIVKERRRLSRQFAELEKRNRAVVDGLIEQAAFLRVQLQELSEDLIENGVTELFQQGEKQDPYDRQRPAANVYNSMNANYQKIIAKLNDLLPKPTAKAAAGDGFDDFVSGRPEM